MANAKRSIPPSKDIPAQLVSRGARASGLLPALLLPAALLLGACGDPSCVFSPGGCNQDGVTPSLGLAAELPTDGGLIRDGQPQVVQAGPIGPNVAPTAPIAIFFSESIGEENLGTAFQVQQVSQFGAPPVPVQPQLIAAGRGIALLPIADLPVGETLSVVYTGGNNQLFDLTGQELDLEDGAVLADFTVGFAAPATPEVIAVWPPSDSTSRSRTPQITVLFDRAMDADSLADPSAWTVLAGGNPPVDDAEPVPLAAGAFGVGGSDTRVWSWESRDVNDELSPLPANTGIELILSPNGSEILGLDGSELPSLTFDFSTGFVRPPTGATLTSQPSDAIGSANLEVGSGSELAIEVSLEEAQAGDFLEILLFGTELEDEDPEFVAVAREVELTGDGPFDSVELGLTDLNLVDDLEEALFADGDLFFGFALRRGTDVSAIDLLDLDGNLAGTQTPLLDTTAPGLFELAGLPTDEGPVVFRSDARDLALFGRATEPLRAVRVTSALGDNVGGGDDPPAVLGSSDNGDFLAASIPLGQLASSDQDLAFEVVLFDRALNASVESFSGTFRQLGGIGPEGLVAGGTGSPIEVEVFDVATLLPIQGAQVFSFQDQGPGSPALPITDASTDASGLASVTSHSAGEIGTILAAQATGYSTFVFHDLRAARISIGLEPTSGVQTTTSASLSVVSPLAQLTVQDSDVVFGDSRFPVGSSSILAAGACTPGLTQELSCMLGPYAATVGRPGSLAAFAANFDITLGTFSPVLFLRGGDVLLGAGPVDADEFTPPVLTIDNLFAEPGVATENLPLAGPVTDISATFTTGIDLDNLITTAPYTSEPRVSIDAPVPGLSGAAVLGAGAGFELSDTDWALRSAFPGEAVSLLAGVGSPADLFHISAEIEDVAGNLSGVRFPETELTSFGGTLFPASVPVVQSPSEGASTGAASFATTIANSLLDDTFQFLDPGFEFGSGFYAVRLTDASGGLFEIVRTDLDDDVTGSIELLLPDLAGSGGVGPASGAATLRARSAAWSGFRPDSFLASDELRERNFFARTAERNISIP